jgi:uncharacterized protein YndB with AHSA1/START domain
MPATAAETVQTEVINSGPDLIVTRLIDAPRDLVFAAWTDPRHLIEWFGPHGFSTTVEQMDVFPGGIFRPVMRGPDGRLYRNTIEYIEIDRPSRLVYRNTPGAGDEPVTFESCVTFEERQGKTLITLRMTFPTAEDRQRNVDTYYSDIGGIQTLERLAAHMPQVAAEHKDERTLTLTRTLKAPRELVFAAWTDPAHLAQWWAPKNFTNPICEADARPGGRWHIVMRAPDGPFSGDYPCGGVYEHVDPPRRLAFTNNALAPDGSVIMRGFTSVTFEEQDGNTVLTLETRALPLIPPMVQAIKGMDQGWSESLDKLVAHMES